YRHSAGLSNFLNELLDAIKYIVPKVLKYAIILFAIIICFTIVAFGIGFFTNTVMSGNFIDFLVGRDLVSNNWFFFTSLALFFLLPAVILVTLLIKAIFKLKNTKNVIQGTSLLWFIVTAFAIVSGLRLAHSFQHFSEKTNSKQFYTSVAIDTLTVDAETEHDYDDFDFDWVHFGDFKIKNNILYSDEIRAKVVKSEKPQVYWEIEYNSNGITQEEANELANSVTYEIKQDGKRLILPRYFQIPKGKVWRNQKVKVTIYVPEGKYLKVTDRAERFVHKLETAADEDGYYEYSGHMWKMGKEGFIDMNPKKDEDHDVDEEEIKGDAVTRDSTNI
ncbi:MAG TPA: hypothetical protein VK590_00035, partial [Saprospiraceae bacterium]|nr:hypothetical protein [Saprospiraceae bacterium]